MRADLKTQRLNRGLSLKALSAETGVSKSTLSRIESEGAEPNPKAKFAIADFYGVEVVELWPVDEVAA